MRVSLGSRTGAFAARGTMRVRLGPSTGALAPPTPPSPSPSPSAATRTILRRCRRGPHNAVSVREEGGSEGAEQLENHRPLIAERRSECLDEAVE